MQINVKLVTTKLKRICAKNVLQLALVAKVQIKTALAVIKRVNCQVCLKITVSNHAQAGQPTWQVCV